MSVLNCLVCDEPVLGGHRWEVRLCSSACATEALFEVVRLEDALDEDVTHASASDATRALIANLQRLQRRALLMRAALAWDELGETATPGGVVAPAPAAVDADEDEHPAAGGS